MHINYFGDWMPLLSEREYLFWRCIQSIHKGPNACSSPEVFANIKEPDSYCLSSFTCDCAGLLPQAHVYMYESHDMHELSCLLILPGVGEL